MSDLISREKAYEVLTEYYHHTTELQHKALREALDMVPSADIDLSDYSDRLWRKAYEQGKADAEPRWVSVEDEPQKEKKRYWVCTDTGYQCECRWTNNVYGFRDSDKWGWSIFDIPQYTKVVAWMPLPEPWEGEADAEV